MLELRERYNYEQWQSPDVLREYGGKAKSKWTFFFFAQVLTFQSQIE